MSRHANRDSVCEQRPGHSSDRRATIEPRVFRSISWREYVAACRHRSTCHTTTVRSPEGIIKVSKGATKVVLALCQDARAIEEKVMAVNDELASRGFRSLGVAATRPGTEKWEFKGVLSLFDPPRVDTKDTIIKAQSMGISVKMVTSPDKTDS